MISEIKYHKKEEALKAVTQNGSELQFSSPKLQNDEEVVMAAIKQHSWSFEYASNELKSNKTFIMKALNEGVAAEFVFYSTKKIKSDIKSFLLL